MTPGVRLFFRKAVCAVVGHKYVEPFMYHDDHNLYVPVHHPEMVKFSLEVQELMDVFNGLKMPVVELDVPRDAQMCARCVRVGYRWASFPRSTK